MKLLLIIILGITLYAQQSYARQIVIAPQGRDKVITALSLRENTLVSKVQNRTRLNQSEVREYIGLLNQKIRQGEVNITNCTGSLLQRINKSLLGEC